MQKVIRDGKVAVLYIPGYGAGRSTWGVPVEGIFHHELVEAVERNATADLIDEGTLFKIVEYDGFDSTEYAENQQWIIS